MDVMKLGEVYNMAVELSKDYGIKLSKSDEFNALPKQYQRRVRDKVYELNINAKIK